MINLCQICRTITELGNCKDLDYPHCKRCHGDSTTRWLVQCQSRWIRVKENKTVRKR